MSPTIDAFIQEDENQLLRSLDVKFFERVLQHSEQELDAQLTVLDVQLWPATRLYDYYSCVKSRAEVTYQQGGAKGVKRLVVKSLAKMKDCPYAKKLLEESHIFETEIGMFTEVLPRFERVLRSIGDTTKLKPDCFYHSINPRKLIICEDLVPQGYQPMGNGPMSLAEAKCAYMKLAKWHAISQKLLSEDPHCFDKYRHSFMQTPNIMAMDFMTSGIENFIEMLESIPEFNTYVPCFRSLKKDLFKNIIDSFNDQINPDKNSSCFVLCHGDFNHKNLMVKRHPKTNELIDVIPTSFEYSYVGCAAGDILYSIFMFLDENLRCYYFEILYFYFTHFTATLKMIGYEGPKPKIMELHEQIKKHKHFELFLLVTCLPIRYELDTGHLDVELFLHSAEYRKSFYKNETYINEIRRLFPIYLRRGYIEKSLEPELNEQEV